MGCRAHGWFAPRCSQERSSKEEQSVSSEQLKDLAAFPPHVQEIPREVSVSRVKSFARSSTDSANGGAGS